LFVVEGPVLWAEATTAGIEVVDLFRKESDSADDDGLGGVDCHLLDAKVFDSVAPTETPRSPIAVCKIPESPSLSSLGGWVMVADGVSDPGNLGTMCRSAEAAGAAAMVVTRGSTDPWSPKCVRSSAGAVFHVPVVRVDTLADVVDAGFETVGTTSHGGSLGATELHGADLGGRIAAVFGNEAHGLAVGAPVARWITIEHAGRSESLNVAMAATVVAMHIAHSRGGAPR
jgi:TrmH family RNA methyltransferase